MGKILNDIVAQHSNGFYIPTDEKVLSRVLELSEDDGSDLLEIAELIATDVGLSAGVLRKINCPNKGMNRTVFDIKQATMIVGKNAINELAIDSSMNAKKKTNCNISFLRFRDDSYTCARLMEYIGGWFKEKIPMELLYTIGLFHDCGIAALGANYSDYKERLRNINNEQFKCQIEMEEHYYQTNHAIIGYFIACGWNFPKEVCKIILMHHEQDILSNINGSQEQLCIALLKLSDTILHKMRFNTHSDDWVVMENDILNVLGISSIDLLDIVDDALEVFLQ